MTRHATSIRRLAALLTLAALNLALRALSRLTDRDKTDSREWTQDDTGGEW